MQRNFEPIRKQIEACQKSELTDVTAKVVIYEAFVEGKLEAPKHFARTVHDLYFEPKYEEFRPRTIWSLSNAFTSAFKELDPVPPFRSEAPKHFARTVHDLYFEPKYEEFRPRTIWSLSNAFTSAFKELDPVPQF